MNYNDDKLELARMRLAAEYATLRIVFWTVFTVTMTLAGLGLLLALTRR